MNSAEMYWFYCIGCVFAILAAITALVVLAKLLFVAIEKLMIAYFNRTEISATIWYFAKHQEEIKGYITKERERIRQQEEELRLIIAEQKKREEHDG